MFPEGTEGGIRRRARRVKRGEWTMWEEFTDTRRTKASMRVSQSGADRRILEESHPGLSGVGRPDGDHPARGRHVRQDHRLQSPRRGHQFTR